MYEDVLITFSAEGWAQLKDAINCLESEDEAAVNSVINQYDVARITEDGEYFLKFDHVKSYTGDFKIFLDCVYNVDSDQFLALFLGDNNSENYDGCYYANPFSITVERIATYVNMGDSFTGDLMQKNNPAKNAPTSMICTDDYTCISCGNTKCSKSEKSCWKCGSIINATRV